MKFGVREICDVVLKAKSDVKIGSHLFRKGEPVIYFDTAKTSTMEGAATTVYAQGGRGNSRLIAWEGEKTLTFTMEDALLSPKGLAILSGADLIQANGKIGASGPVAGANIVIAHTTQTVMATSDDDGTTVKLVLEGSAPNATQPIYVMLLDSNGEMSGVPMKVTAEGNEITVTNFIKQGEIALVDYYVDHMTDAMQIDITPDKFAGYYYLEASTLFRRQSDGVDLPAEFIIPKVKIQSNFTFTMASSGDPSSFTFTMDAFPDYTIADPTKKVLASIQILSADDNYDLNTGSVDALTYERYDYQENQTLTGGGYITTTLDGVLTGDDKKYTAGG